MWRVIISAGIVSILVFAAAMYLSMNNAGYDRTGKTYVKKLEKKRKSLSTDLTGECRNPVKRSFTIFWR